MVRLTRNLSLMAALLFLLACGIKEQKSSVKEENPPNVVFIYADDLGRGLLSSDLNNGHFTPRERVLATVRFDSSLFHHQKGQMETHPVFK